MHNHHRRFHRAGAAVAVALATLLTAGVALLWSWNTLAVELFSAPVMRFKHALAVELIVVAICALARLSWPRPSPSEGTAS